MPGHLPTLRSSERCYNHGRVVGGLHKNSVHCIEIAMLPALALDSPLLRSVEPAALTLDSPYANSMDCASKSRRFPHCSHRVAGRGSTLRWHRADWGDGGNHLLRN
eukprot:1194531-Prorocentrum_minimum.AAC.12